MISKRYDVSKNVGYVWMVFFFFISGFCWLGLLSFLFQFIEQLHVESFAGNEGKYVFGVFLFFLFLATNILVSKLTYDIYNYVISGYYVEIGEAEIVLGCKKNCVKIAKDSIVIFPSNGIIVFWKEGDRYVSMRILGQIFTTSKIREMINDFGTNRYYFCKSPTHKKQFLTEIGGWINIILRNRYEKILFSPDNCFGDDQ